VRATTIWLLALGAAFAAIAGGSAAAPGTFPGQNGVLAFDAVYTGGGGGPGSVQIFQVSATGSGLKQLTQTTGTVWNQDPQFSANGAQIYFTSADRSTTNPSRIYSMSANGSGRHGISEGVWPSVNRAASSLAVVQYLKGGQSVIASMKSNGTGRRVVGPATRQQSAGAPDFAPAGGRIAFYRVTYNKSGQGFAASDLFVRNGTRNTNITRGSSAKFFSPAWAPNGKTLLAIRGQRTIVAMKPNGTGVRALTSVSGAHTGIASAVYSPDGTKIAYLQCAGDCGDPELHGQGSIWLMNANGSGKHRIFNGGNGVQPADRLSWSVS
jgi:Tol biopolymer transport system component